MVDRSVNLNTECKTSPPPPRRVPDARASPPLACNYRYLLLVNAGRPAGRPVDRRSVYVSMRKLINPIAKTRSAGYRLE